MRLLRVARRERTAVESLKWATCNFVRSPAMIANPPTSRLERSRQEASGTNAPRHRSVAPMPRRLPLSRKGRHGLIAVVAEATSQRATADLRFCLRDLRLLSSMCASLSANGSAGSADRAWRTALDTSERRYLRTVLRDSPCVAQFPDREFVADIASADDASITPCDHPRSPDGRGKGSNWVSSRGKNVLTRVTLSGNQQLCSALLFRLNALSNEPLIVSLCLDASSASAARSVSSHPSLTRRIAESIRE